MPNTFLLVLFLASSLGQAADRPNASRTQCNSGGWLEPNVSFLSVVKQGNEEVSVRYVVPSGAPDPRIEKPLTASVTHELIQIVPLEPPRSFGEGALAVTHEVFSARLNVKKKNGEAFYSQVTDGKPKEVIELSQWVICHKHTYQNLK